MRLNEFMEGFGIITAKLKEMYQMITLGGDAELELVDSLDPFTEGIVFSVRPPKKSWKNISNLSGNQFIHGHTIGDDDAISFRSELLGSFKRQTASLYLNI